MKASDETLGQRIERLSSACREVLSHLHLPVAAVFLYGSALGEGFRPDSDLDIAVLDGEEGLSWGDQARLMDALERATRCGVDLRMLRESTPSHQAHVVEEGLLVWPPEPGPAVEDYTRGLLAVARGSQRTKREWNALLARFSSPAAHR